MTDKHDNEKKTSEPLGLPPDLVSISDADTERGERSIETSLPGNELVGRKTAQAQLDASNKTPVIEGYQISRKLGQGGMGSVFLATDKTLTRQVAIKIVSQTFQENSGLLDRFESEIQTLAALRHPHIAQLFSAGSCQDLPYFVMEFVDGPTLESFAKQPLKAKQVASIVSQLCEAVAYCHKNGVLHRDLKPSNVLLDEKLQPKIADFGLAKAIGADSSSTRTGEILGTPGYMAPEQASGVVKSFTAACDVYALGAILYRLLTGRPPFVAAEPLQAIMQVLADEPIPPRKLVGNVPHDLQTICMKCLEKKVARRYQSADDLRDDLQCFLNGKPISARPARAVEKSAKWIKRNPAKALLISSVGVMAAAMVIGLTMHNRVLADELAKTQRLADHGSELSNWLINDHLATLNSLAGTTQPRHDLAERVREFLNASYADIPPDPKYTRRLGNSYARLAAISGGEDVNNLGNHQQAVEYYLRALELYDQADNSGLDEEVGDVRNLRVSAQLSLSNTYLELADAEASDRYFALAKQSLQLLETTDWETQFLKFQIQTREALALMARNEIEPALAAWQTLGIQLEEVKDLAPQVEFENQQIFLATHRGDCLSSLGRNPESETAFLVASELAGKAATTHPGNVLFQRRWSTCLERLGNCLFAQEKPSEALEQFVQARDIAKRIVEVDRESVEAAMGLASKYTNISDAHYYLQEIPAAQQSIEKAIEIYQSLRKQQQLGLTGKRQLAICMQSQANIMMMTGDTTAAEKLYEQHEALCQELISTDRDSIPELTQLGENHFQRSLLLLSGWMESGFDPETARTSETYLEIIKQLDQSHACFERIAKAGTLNVNQQAFQDRIGSVRELIESTIDQLLAVEDEEQPEIF